MPNGSSTNVGTWQENRGLQSCNSCGASRTVSLTFDDGPDAANTAGLLTDLANLKVQATFFLSPAINGQPTIDQCNLVSKIIDGGHSIQSHSWDHRDFLTLNGQEIHDNLALNYQWIKQCANSRKLDVTMFRPPYGDMSVEGAQYISKMGYTLASWNIDTQDATGLNAQQVFANVQAGFANVGDGNSVVILMHDRTHPVTREALPMIVSYFQSLNYKFVTLPDCYKACGSAVCKTVNHIWPGTWDSIF